MEGEAKCQLALESSGKKMSELRELQKKILRLLKENSKQNIVLVLDITMDFYSDALLQSLLNSFDGYVRQKRVEIYLFQSCAKLIQLGTDLFPGGMYIHLGHEQLPKQSSDLILSGLETYLSWFLDFFQKDIVSYCEIVRRNNQKLFNDLYIPLSNEGLVLIPNTDIASAYFALKVNNVEDHDLFRYAEMVLDIFLEKAIDNGYAVYDRRSFGFWAPNINVTGFNLRIACGLQSEQEISQIADLLIDIAQLLKFISKHRSLDSWQIKSVETVLRQVLIANKNYQIFINQKEVLAFLVIFFY